MKTNKLAAFLAMLVTTVGALLFVGAPHAFAATKTWTGTDCPATDCDWSNVNNWSGGVIPANGDDIVINADTTNPGRFQTTVNDIVGLSVASITTSGYSNSGAGEPYSLNINSITALTITGNVTHNVTATPAPVGWHITSYLNIGNSGYAITLGGTSTFQNARISASTLALGGNTLNYNLGSAYTGNTTFSLDANITGAGTFNINIPTNIVLFLNTGNTYSGTTNINTVDYIDSSGNSTTMFGSSTINLSSTGRILFEPSVSGAVTISNPINVTPPSVTGTFLNNQLEFWSTSGGNTYTVPNITLLGNARFGTNVTGGAVTVNLAGITANSHCIQYGDNNQDVADFSNGPAACVVAVAAGAAAPNTGFRKISSNPIVILSATLIAAASIFYIARSSKLVNKKR